jgi:hypothetical protein
MWAKIGKCRNMGKRDQIWINVENIGKCVEFGKIRIHLGNVNNFIGKMWAKYWLISANVGTCR